MDSRKKFRKTWDLWNAERVHKDVNKAFVNIKKSVDTVVNNVNFEKIECDTLCRQGKTAENQHFLLIVNIVNKLYI